MSSSRIKWTVRTAIPGGGFFMLQSSLPWPPVQAAGKDSCWAAAMLDNAGGQISEMSAVSLSFFNSLAIWKFFHPWLCSWGQSPGSGAAAVRPAAAAATGLPLIFPTTQICPGCSLPPSTSKSGAGRNIWFRHPGSGMKMYAAACSGSRRMRFFTCRR